MKSNISIQLKATFLIIVFGLNTLVGFACAIGVDFNASRQQASTKKSVATHIHADGKKHQHKAKKTSRDNQQKRTIQRKTIAVTIK